MLYLNDPKDGKPSVSLSLLLVSFILAVGFGAAQALGKTQSMGPLLEIFYSMTCLYFGRRFTFKGQQYTSDKAEAIKEKIEE